ncbi:inactive hydroxysteroid dehydrogenase-like protein 1 [Neocloeon triangulifer]|uniref:inactive hydroxysteroid dehydrogenase-like protein 1 n=1 Tax=Neocloeon triangulifer TaxID=2078957 RepID=UPI00286EEFDC|nr:inactive hydroxysteroid dehydrogenase-like protein 1 [Neocloeon triangulifer]
MHSRPAAFMLFSTTANMDALSLVIALYHILALFLVAKHLSSFLFNFLGALYVHFIAKLICKPVDLTTRYGKWAVITGASSGIGKYYALELAKKGMNVVLISKNLEKLKKVEEEIKQECEVATIVIVADFTGGQEVYKKIWEDILDLEIGILVNNVGALPRRAMRLEEAPVQQLWDMVMVNVGTATAMTHLILPGMKYRGRGMIVNLSSAVHSGPCPYFSIYAAAKAYITSFTDAIRLECEGSGVEIQTLHPWYVRKDAKSEVTTSEGGTICVPTAKLYAKHAVATLGVAHKTAGYWPHGVQDWIWKMMGDFMWAKCVQKTGEPYMTKTKAE